MSSNQSMAELIEFGYVAMDKYNAYPFCGAIVKDGVFISRGFNEATISTGDSTRHGEMEALRLASVSLDHLPPASFDGYELFSTCEPCLACFDAGLWTGVRKFVYSVGQEDFPEYFNEHAYSIINYTKDNPGEIIVESGVLKEEGIALFNAAKAKYGW